MKTITRQNNPINRAPGKLSHWESGREARKAAQRGRIQTITTHSSLIILSLLFLFPLFYMISRSLMSAGDVNTQPPVIWPNVLHWENFGIAWSRAPFLQFLLNTLIIVGLNIVGVTVSSALCGFGFARLRFPGRNIIFGVVLATIMLPPTVTLIPLYIVFRNWNWLDTFLPLTVPGFFGGGAFNIFLFRQFFMSLPRELDEAALIDGANTWQIFTRIILPLSIPAVTVVATLTFIANWTDIFGPIIFLNQQQNWTLAQGALSVFTNSYLGGVPQVEYVAAIGMILVVPPLLLYAFLQRYLLEGIALTGLKG